MCVIELDGDLVGESGEVDSRLATIAILVLLVAAEDVLECRTDEEVLLLETEFFALGKL